jgi:hypothetical protein
VKSDTPRLTLVAQALLEKKAADHPQIEDIKRKDFIGLCGLTRQEVTGARLVELSAARFAAAAPWMRFLCEAAGVRY